MAITVKSKSAPPAPPTGVDELLTPGEVQAWLRISRPTFYRWLARKTFPAHTALVGCRPRWKRSAIQAWIDAGGTTQAKG